MIVLSRYQAIPLLLAREQRLAEVEISLDLNRTRATVALDAEGVQLTADQYLAWDALATIADHETGCFVVAEGAIERLYQFSETTRRAVSLCGHSYGAPTLLVAGFPMHRTKNTDPMEDTEHKLAALKPFGGRVLDICMGLGYTAIGATRTALSVLTLELDPAVEAIAARNPWSRPLFDDPRITRQLGDANAILPTLATGSFDNIFHDPPTFQLAGELYSLAFYRELYRVLGRRGRVFHYIGDPESRHGATVTKGVVKRLHEAGFTKVTPAAAAYGVVAQK